MMGAAYPPDERGLSPFAEVGPLRELTSAEVAAARRVVAGEPDAAVLLAALGLDGAA